MDIPKIKGAIYGAIIGDIMGLRYEGVNKNYIKKENICKKTFYNQYSDDTEHLIIMLKSLSETHDINEFNNHFSKSLQKWLFTLPYGIGKATIKSIIKSFFTKNSGVKSTGNGALMRSGVIGLIIEEPKTIEKYVKANVKKTHISEESYLTSLIFANIINQIIFNKENITKEYVINYLSSFNNKEIQKYTNLLETSLNNNITSNEFANLLTNNKSLNGYTIWTLFISLFVFLQNINNYDIGLKEIISLGGDTDTNAFVYGMISGSYNGYQNIPKEYNDLLKSIKIDEIIYAMSYKNNNKININYFKLFIKNISIIPLIFIEIFIRYIFIILNIKR